MEWTIDDLIQQGIVDGRSRRVLRLSETLSATLDHIKVSGQLLSILNSTEFQTDPNAYLAKMMASTSIRHYIVRAVYDVLEYIVAKKLFGVSCSRSTSCPCGDFTSIDKCILAIISNDNNIRDQYTSDDITEAINRIRQCCLVKELPWRV